MYQLFDVFTYICFLILQTLENETYKLLCDISLGIIVKQNLDSFFFYINWQCYLPSQSPVHEIPTLSLSSLPLRECSLLPVPPHSSSLWDILVVPPALHYAQFHISIHCPGPLVFFPVSLAPIPVPHFYLPLPLSPRSLTPSDSHDYFIPPF